MSNSEVLGKITFAPRAPPASPSVLISANKENPLTLLRFVDDDRDPFCLSAFDFINSPLSQFPSDCLPFIPTAVEYRHKALVSASKGGVAVIFSFP